MTHEFELQDARIIQSHEHLEVLCIRHEVMWPDGSQLGLHPVREHDAPAALLRAIHHKGQWLVVDLRKLAPKVAEDLRLALPRDVPGTLIYGLRATFARSTDCLAKLQQATYAQWAGPARPHDPARRRGDAPAVLHHAAA